MENLQGASEPEVPFLESEIRKFLTLFPERYSKPSTEARFQLLINSGAFPATRAALLLEVEEMLVHWRSLHVELTFTHNDLLLKNIVFNKKLGTFSYVLYLILF